MKKIVINKCFGGFSLSDLAYRRYADIAGLTLYPADERFGAVTYWTVPPADRVAELPGQWNDHPQEARQAYNAAYRAQTIYHGNLERDDPVLVRVVEELGKDAGGRFSSLAVVEVPDDAEWEISEYDGSEHIAEKHRTWY